MSFGSLGISQPFGAAANTNSNAVAHAGPDLEEILTEALAFQKIAGDAKLQLLPSSWPTDNLPPSTSSLLSVAPRNGLLAAAGPTSVIIASTESVRQAYTAAGGGRTKSFTPQLTLNVGTRISQVAFSTDEQYLILSAEQGGGLAVYEVLAFKNGMTEPAFQIGTGGNSLRALIPNPAQEKAELICLISTNGELMMANLSARQLLAGTQGSILQQGVSCASWSPKGKQLVAGRGDGTCVQLTPEGEVKKEIPRPPQLESDQHVSSLFWLENDLFLLVYTPSSSEDDPPASKYLLATRAKPPQNGIAFQLLQEPCAPFVAGRGSPIQHMLRLKEFPPDLSDAIVVASTASDGVGLLTRSKKPLGKEMVTDVTEVSFTTTLISEDACRAQLPMSDTSNDTSPIGVAFDLSGKDKVSKPLPKEEFTHSPGPLPALMVLDNEGILSTWWFVYADSIRSETVYPGLAAVEQSSAPAQTQIQTPFGAQPAAAPSGIASGAATFGQQKATFGAPSIGIQSSPWTSQPNTSAPAVSNNATAFGQGVFGQPAFGSTTAIGSNAAGPSFGASGGLGNRGSVWGSPAGASAAPSGSTFGRPSFGAPANPFGGNSSTPNANSKPATSSLSSGGFASFATNSSAFAVAGNATSGGSGFGDGTSGSSFQTAKPAEPLLNQQSKPQGLPSWGGAGQNSTGSLFGQQSKPQGAAPSNPFGAPTSTVSPFAQQDKVQQSPNWGGAGFTLGSTFKSDGTAANDGPKPADTATESLFGSGFGASLKQAESETTQSKDAEMDDDMDETKPAPLQETSKAEPSPASQTPITKPNESTVTKTAPPVVGGFFGTQSSNTSTPARVETSVPTALPTESEETSRPLSESTILDAPAVPLASRPPKIKAEPQSPKTESRSIFDRISHQDDLKNGKGQDEGEDASEQTPHASTDQSEPLPIESTSKTSYAPGESSVSSNSSAEEPRQLERNISPSETRAQSKLDKSASHPTPEDARPEPKAEGTAASEASTVPEEDDDSGDEDEDDFEEREFAEEERDADGEEDEETDRSDEEEHEEEGLGDDEGSGIDLAHEISSPSEANPSSKMSPESSFGAPKSPAGDLFSRSSTAQGTPRDKPLFGEVGGKAVPFLQPSKTQESPRSPSPVRQLVQLRGDILRPDNSRSVSAPGLPGASYNSAVNRRIANNQITVPVKQREVSLADVRHQAEDRAALEHSRRLAEEEQDLSDKEDDQIRGLLEAPVDASRTLDPFLAHQDYAGEINKPGIPGQIERVYRDINSMIDTLGLNARSLEAFVKGHSKDPQEIDEPPADLEHPEDWSLTELSRLQALEGSIQNDVGIHSDPNFQPVRDTCREIQEDLKKLNDKRREIGKSFERRKQEPDPQSQQSAPLSLSQSSQQHDLRKLFLNHQNLIAEAEKELSVLRAKLASCDAHPDSSSSTKKPTFEAVTKTILKMTSMIEDKAEEVDQLGSQLRYLRLTSPSNSSSRPASRQSGHASSPSTRSSPSSSTLKILPSGPAVNKSLAKAETPSHLRGSTFRSSPLRNSLLGTPPASRGGFTVPGYGTPGTNADDSEDEDDEEAGAREKERVQRIRGKIQRRKDMNRVIRAHFEQTGPRIRPLEG